MLTVIMFIAGLVLLVAGAELLVRGASKLALAFGISPLVVGLTIVAFGTSTPEVAVSVKAALANQPDLVTGNRETVLLVEDDADVAAIALDQLESFGLDVEWVETGPEALEALERARFDVMLTDVVMPGGLNGIQLAKAVVSSAYLSESRYDSV